jgi:hypothetical protein
VTDNATMQIAIPGVNFEQLARETIAAKLTEAMLGSDETIRQIVVAGLERKVNERGVVSERSYDNTIPFIQWIAEDMLRKVTLDVIKAKIESLRPLLEKAVEAGLKKSANASAKVLVDALARSAAQGYGFTADVVIKSREMER